MSLKVAITGAHGLVGSALVLHLQKLGYEVIKLSRGEHWDIENQSVDKARLEGIDALVHLAGINLVSEKWTEEFKQKVSDSRVEGTRLLARALAQLEKKPRVMVMASAVGYYGGGWGHVFTEDDGPGEGFLAKLCIDWEAAAKPAEDAGIQVTRARLGAVLAAEGGAMEKMLPFFKFGLGGPLGSGKQAFPWIGLMDAVKAFEFLIKNAEIDGPVNLVAPQILTQREFAVCLGKALHRPAFLPLPAFAARLMFGEMADEMLLKGQAVKPVVLLESGFEFKHANLEKCFADLFSNVSV